MRERSWERRGAGTIEIPRQTTSSLSNSHHPHQDEDRDKDAGVVQGPLGVTTVSADADDIELAFERCFSDRDRDCGHSHAPHSSRLSLNPSLHAWLPSPPSESSKDAAPIARSKHNTSLG